MNDSRTRFRPACATVLALAGLIGAPAGLAADAPGSTINEVNEPDGLRWETTAKYQSATLVVTGPGDFRWQQSFGFGDTLFLDFAELTARHAAPDGQYQYELVLTPVVKRADRALAIEARALGQSVDFLAAKAIAALSGSFAIADGLVVDRDLNEPSLKDFVVADDMIIQGSLCVGLDCINNENFSFDTIRLKENNLRIHFEDTSIAAGFPSHDWRIIINDSNSGGANYFAVEDAINTRQVFRVTAGAPADSLVVSNAGRVGVRTAVPALDVHIASGNTPALRLEQNGSSGFTAQTWDVAGNETNFFVRDATGGSKLPLRIQPAAPSNSVLFKNNGDVGLGSSAPAAPLHVVRAGPVQLRLDNTTSGVAWNLNSSAPGDFRIAVAGAAGTVMALTTTGNMTVSGNYFSATCTAPGSPCAPDYVFDDDYQLMSLEDLSEFIRVNRHLPNVPSEDDLRRAQTLNMNAFQMTLLEKIEELTLYTLQQEKTIRELASRLDQAGPAEARFDPAAERP